MGGGTPGWQYSVPPHSYLPGYVVGSLHPSPEQGTAAWCTRVPLSVCLMGLPFLQLRPQTVLHLWKSPGQPRVLRLQPTARPLLLSTQLHAGETSQLAHVEVSAVLLQAEPEVGWESPSCTLNRAAMNIVTKWVRD